MELNYQTALKGNLNQDLIRIYETTSFSKDDISAWYKVAKELDSYRFEDMKAPEDLLFSIIHQPILTLGYRNYIAEGFRRLQEANYLNIFALQQTFSEKDNDNSSRNNETLYHLQICNRLFDTQLKRKFEKMKQDQLLEQFHRKCSYYSVAHEQSYMYHETPFVDIYNYAIGNVKMLPSSYLNYVYAQVDNAFKKYLTEDINPYISAEDQYSKKEQEIMKLKMRLYITVQGSVLETKEHYIALIALIEDYIDKGLWQNRIKYWLQSGLILRDSQSPNHKLLSKIPAFQNRIIG